MPHLSDESLESFLAHALQSAEQAAALCSLLEPSRATVADFCELDAALDAWLAKRNLARHQAA